MKKKYVATIWAILAAVLYALNTPVSKQLLNHIDATMMAALLYLGAGAGVAIIGLADTILGNSNAREHLTKKELPYTIGMIVLDIAAPILLMLGIERTTSANVSLLNNFEIVATSLIAFLLFKEAISRKLWIAIIMVTIASIVLGFEGTGTFAFNVGSLFVIGACICWGFENNCTRKISNKSAAEIVMIKGCFSGLGSLSIAFVIGEHLPSFVYLFAAMALGFVAYGVSIYVYILAQKELGAAKTSAYYSIAPFVGVILCMVINGERPAIQFYIALIIMIVATYVMLKDSIELQHTHEHVHIHCHEHSHGDFVHCHEHSHVHSHMHIHEERLKNHEHTHPCIELNEHEHSHRY